MTNLCSVNVIEKNGRNTENLSDGRNVKSVRADIESSEIDCQREIVFNSSSKFILIY